jgi:hypothetical protein
VEQTKQFICLRPLVVRFDLAGLLDKELGLLPVVRFTKAVLSSSEYMTVARHTLAIATICRSNLILVHVALLVPRFRWRLSNAPPFALPSPLRQKSQPLNKAGATKRAGHLKRGELARPSISIGARGCVEPRGRWTEPAVTVAGRA